MLTILHASDFHVGLALRRFGGEVANRLREERVRAMENAMAECQRRKVWALIITGDTFDDHNVDQATATRVYDALRSGENGPHVFILPGNHDHFFEGSIWTRGPWAKCLMPDSLWEKAGRGEVIQENELPRGPIVLQRRVDLRLETKAGRLHLFPCPVMRKSSSENPTAWIKSVPFFESAFRLGLAHGSVQDRPNIPDYDHPIPVSAAGDLFLDYLALGHWHGQSVYPGPDGTPRMAYAGTGECKDFDGAEKISSGWEAYVTNKTDADVFRGEGRGKALLVTFKRPGGTILAESISVGRLAWQHAIRNISSMEDFERVVSEVRNWQAPEQVVLRLTLRGTVSAAVHDRLDELRGWIGGGRFAHSELDIGNLACALTEREKKQFFSTGSLSEMLATLETEAVEDGENAQIAQRAILALYDLVALKRRADATTTSQA